MYLDWRKLEFFIIKSFVNGLSIHLANFTFQKICVTSLQSDWTMIMSYSPNVCSFSPYCSVKRENFRGDNLISLSVQSESFWILAQVIIGSMSNFIHIMIKILFMLICCFKYITFLKKKKIPILCFVGNDEKCENSPGYHLCKSLIPVYEQSVVRSSDHRSMERLHAASALRNLLAVSQSAKSVALESKTSGY